MGRPCPFPVCFQTSLARLSASVHSALFRRVSPSTLFIALVVERLPLPGSLPRRVKAEHGFGHVQTESALDEVHAVLRLGDAIREGLPHHVSLAHAVRGFARDYIGRFLLGGFCYARTLPLGRHGNGPTGETGLPTL